MQGNTTILDEQKFYDKDAMFKGRKPAKLSTYKVFYPKTVALQNSIKKNIQSEPVASQDIKQSEVHETPAITPTEVTPAVQAPVEPQVEVNNVVKLPSKETLETRMQNINATIYKGVSGNVVDFTTYRRLKIGPPVVESMENATEKIGIEPTVLKPVEPVEEPKKEPIDFSQFPNVIKFPGTELSSEPTQEKNISSNLSKAASEKLDNILNGNVMNNNNNVNIINIDKIREKEEILNKKLENISRIDASMQEIAVTIAQYEEELASYDQELDDEIERTDDIELEKTTEYSDMQAKLIQLQEAMRRRQEKVYQTDEFSYGKSRSA